MASRPARPWPSISIGDPNRLKTDLWMQTSTDDGQTWSTAVKVTSSESDETGSGAHSQQYGDYIGLSGHFGNFFPAWTDQRNGIEEIWTSQLTVIQKRCYFIVDKSTFGQDEVAAMLQAGTPTVDAAFYVVVEGFTAAALGITAGDLSGAPTHKPTLTPSPAVAGMTIGQPTRSLRRTTTFQPRLSASPGCIRSRSPTRPGSRSRCGT